MNKIKNWLAKYGLIPYFIIILSWIVYMESLPLTLNIILIIFMCVGLFYLANLISDKLEELDAKGELDE